MQTKTETIDWVTLFKNYKSHVYAVVFLVLGSVFGVTADDITAYLPTDPRVDKIIEKQEELLTNDQVLQVQINELNDRVDGLEGVKEEEDNGISIQGR